MTAIRSILFALFLPVFTAVVAVILAPTLLRENWARWATKIWSVTVLKVLFLCCGLDYRVDGRQDLPEGGAIYAVKHQSMWETVALVHLLPKPIFILKQELLTIPVFGWWCRAAGYVGINRDGGSGALRDMVKAALAATDDGKQVIIFPEGTRIPYPETGRYLPGVAGLYTNLNVPCIPVAHNAGRYWRHPGMMRLPGMIQLKFLPAIETGLKRRAFLTELERIIEGQCRLLRDVEADTSVEELAQGCG